MIIALQGVVCFALVLGLMAPPYIAWAATAFALVAVAAMLVAFDDSAEVLEPFTTKVGEKVVDPVGPWVLRWKVERFSGGRVLLKAGEFTWELTPLDMGETPEK